MRLERPLKLRDLLSLSEPLGEQQRYARAAQQRPVKVEDNDWVEARFSHPPDRNSSARWAGGHHTPSLTNYDLSADGRPKVQTKCKHAPRHSTTSANRAEAKSSAIEPNRRTPQHPTTLPKRAHNPKVAGSNPAPAMPLTGTFGSPSLFPGVCAGLR
jgi:hypothetical protein